MAKSGKLVRVYQDLNITDSVGNIPSQVKDQVSNIIYDERNKETGMSLLSEAAVTYAGIVNANMGYYKPEKLQASVDTWVKPYNKPVLTHHDKSKDPIGRVMGSIWKPTVPTFVPKVQNSVYDTDYTYRGLGHIQNLLSINDADAVNKVLDGRYLTLSVSGDNDEMTCSICQQEWLNDGKCSHKFGRYYEDERSGSEKLAYWTAGDFLWDEVSFVNEPAMPFAQILTKEVAGGSKDEILQVYNYKDVTSLEKPPVEDCSKRLFKFYVVNDSKGMVVEINDSTDLKALYKLYDAHPIVVGANLKLENKEQTTLADEKTPQPEVVVTSEKPVEVAATVTVESKPEAVVAPAEPVADSKPEPIVAAVEDKKPEPTATVVDSKPLEDKITALETSTKTLTDQTKQLEDEKKSLNDQLIAMQASVRDAKLEQILDLKETLNLDSYATVEDRNKSKSALAGRSMETLDQQIADLRESLKKINTKRPQPVAVKVGDSEANDAKRPVDIVLDRIGNMSAKDLIALKLSGRFNPAVKK